MLSTLPHRSTARTLQQQRHFSFLPYAHRLSRILKFRHQPENTKHGKAWGRRWEHGDSDDVARESRWGGKGGKVWGRRWEYEEKDGVARERSSEYVPGKGWVDADQKSGKEAGDEFDIDLITMKRVPRRGAYEVVKTPGESLRRTSSERGAGGATSGAPVVTEHRANIERVTEEASSNAALKGIWEEEIPRQKDAKAQGPPDKAFPEPKSRHDIIAEMLQAEIREALGIKLAPRPLSRPTTVEAIITNFLRANTDAPREEMVPPSLPPQSKTVNQQKDAAAKVAPSSPMSAEPHSAESDGQNKGVLSKSSIPVKDTKGILPAPAKPPPTSVGTEKSPENGSNQLLKEHIPASVPLKPNTQGDSIVAQSTATIAAKEHDAPVVEPSVTKGDSPTPPLAPQSTTDERLKYHRLNIANRPSESLGSPDADVDILLPSDVRAAAGAPGKTIIKPETEAEKKQRRDKMAEEFDVSYEQRESLEMPERRRKEVVERLLRVLNEERHILEELSRERQRIEERIEEEERKRAAGKVERIPQEVRTESEDYAWSGTEDVSAEDVLGVKTSPASPPQDTVSAGAQKATPEPDTGPAYRFFALIRNPEDDRIQFTTLPKSIISPNGVLGGTAFDSLQKLDSPKCFLPLWIVLQKGGFTVVGGEKDCLVVKVDADVARGRQELVLKEIRAMLSPADVVARESGEEKKAGNKADEASKNEYLTERQEKITEPVEVVVNVPLKSPVVAPETTTKVTSIPPSEAEAVTAAPEEVLREKETQKESSLETETGRPKKRRPFRRAFWTAVWVGALSGAVNVSIETYL